MRPQLSVRSRVLLGAILWTLGFFMAAVIISTIIMLRYQYVPRIMHGTAHAYGGWLSVGVVILLVIGFIQFKRGLSPLGNLRSRLAAVHAGRERRVEGRYPAEVQPLVDDLNALLEHREQTVRRALSKAGDLAHGLKTPLAVLAHEAERARASGHAELADHITQQVERMNRQVEYHLAHARAAASGATPGASCLVRESAEALSRTLQQLHASRGLTIRVDVPADQVARAQREDLDEMLGNLLDNACKWARSSVSVTASENGGGVVIVVDDDGPGLAPEMRDVVLQRGVRADQAAPGSGLGLGIVRDLAEVYGGSIALEDSPAGGLRARLQLPGIAGRSV